MLTIFALTIVVLLTIHWIADFVFQSRWMANNKSTSLLALTIHVAVYTAVLGIGVACLALWVIGTTTPAIIIAALQFAGAFAVINGVLHWVTDFITSKITAALYKEGMFYEFFVVVGFDQLLHAATLVLSYFWLLSV